MIAVALLLLVQAPPAEASASPDIVVLGHRVEDARAALKACIARHCPPDEDVKATLTLAETQFTTGAYADARGTLHAALSRNRGARAQHPDLIAGLWRADSRIAIHLGDTAGFRTSQLAALKVMKDTHPANGRDVLIERLELGAVDDHLGRVEMAHQTYAAVAREAEKVGAYDLQGFASFYDAQMYARRAVAGGMYETVARRRIADLVATTRPELAPFRTAATRLGLRLDARSGDAAAVERLLAAYRGETTQKPVLVYAPKVRAAAKIGTDAVGASTGTVVSGNGIEQRTLAGGGDFHEQWGDVAFSVQPDGTVADVEVLRHSRTFDSAWMKPVLTAIGGRRYAPLDAKALPDGLTRLERYTLTAHTMTVTGSNIQGQEVDPQIEMMDLSDEGQETKPVR